MNDLTIEELAHDKLKTFTVVKSKQFIKDKELVKTRICKKKVDYIECILENKDYIFGGEKPNELKKTRKIRLVTEEKTKCYDKSLICASLDETGLGSLAGPAFVCAVIMPNECPTPDDLYKVSLWNSITDSKKISKSKIESIYNYVKEVAIDWQLAIVDEKEIDKINIRQARLQGFHRALDKLTADYDKILVDGDIFYNYYRNQCQVPHVCIKQGDAKFRSIAAASIIAKFERDRYMKKLHIEYPMYNWNTNCGYAGGRGKTHIDLIKNYGITKYHRKTFGICKQWETLPQGNLK